MNSLGIFLVGLGLIYLIYCILSRNKVLIYNRYHNMKIVDKEKFLNLQLYFSIFNSLIIIICGLIIIRYDLYRINIGRYNFGGIYAFTPPLIFHCINYLLKKTALKKKYIVKE